MKKLVSCVMDWLADLLDTLVSKFSGYLEIVSSHQNRFTDFIGEKVLFKNSPIAFFVLTLAVWIALLAPVLAIMVYYYYNLIDKGLDYFSYWDAVLVTFLGSVLAFICGYSTVGATRLFWKIRAKAPVVKVLSENKRVSYLVQLYALNIVLFGAFYFIAHLVWGEEALSGLGGESNLSAFIGSFYFSIVTVTTLGYGDVLPNNSWTRILVSVQVLWGMGLVVLYLGSVIGSGVNDNLLATKHKAGSDDGFEGKAPAKGSSSS